MTKSELRNGMLVQLRRGSWHVIIMGAKEHMDNNVLFIDINDGCYMNINDYNDNLDYIEKSDSFEIMKIAECNYVGDVLRGIKAGIEVTDYKGFKVLWTREDSEASKVKSLIAELQGQLSAAQAKLEALQ